VAETYDALSPADLEAVEEVAQVLDLVERLRAAIASGPLVETRQGGPRVRPEVVEIRLQTNTLDKLLRRFPGLDEEG
jgi:hypothetical protein